MKKNYIKFLLGIIFITPLLVNCSDDYLETEPSGLISADQITKASELNPGLQNANIAGLYSTMYSEATGGTGGHDDFGQKGYDIYSDILCGDMVLGGLNYGWYSGLARYTATVDYTDISNYKVWRYYYRVIYGANQVVDGLGGNDAVPETQEGKEIMGQAKAMRAYAYFYLANFFSTEYNPAEEIIPIYDNTKVPNQPKSTTEAVYKLIVSDLNDAIKYLDTFKRSGKQMVDKYVAKGLLAYVYSTMGKYAEAAQLADDVIKNGGFTLMTAEGVVGGFNDIASPLNAGWMWGVDLTLDIGLDLLSWWGQVDYYTYSYAAAGDPKIINWELYKRIPNDDVRKKQFFNRATMSMPYKKFYDPNREPMGQRKITTDYVYMRVAEMYLLKAENLAKTGNDAGAKETLKELVSKRMPDASYIDNLSGEALKDEIYFQIRAELWGEGKSYLAMKRNKATIVRGSNDLVLAGKKYKYNAEELTFLIPQNEIDNNPNISK